MTLDAELFDRTFSRFVQYATRSLEDELRNQARLFVIDAIKVTPPFHQGAGQGVSHAKKTGERSIERNIHRIFIPTQLKRSRQITHLFGAPNIPGSPWTVPTKEKIPDIETIYAAQKNLARMKSKMRMPKMRMWVSERKVNTIIRREKKKVGWLAAGWMVAANALGATSRVPAWVRRHSGSPGAIEEEFTANRLRIAIENRVKYAHGVGGMERRARFALRKRIDAMERQIPRLARRAEKELRGG